MLILRHLKDEDDIRKFGFDSPIQPNQEEIARNLMNRIVLLSKYRDVEILYASPRRFKESIDLMSSYLDQEYNFVSKKDARLDWIRDGKIKLDDNYIKGDNNLDILNAWSIFTEEINNGNYAYILGNPNGADKYYKSLVGRYTEFGGTISDLRPFLSLMLDLITNNKDNTVLCCRHVAIRVILLLSEHAKTGKVLTIDFLAQLYTYLNKNYGVTDFENYYGKVLQIDISNLNKENVTLGLNQIINFMDKSILDNDVQLTLKK